APLTRIPEGLDPMIAAALPTAGATALEIVESLEPLAGKTVLVVGAAGGVGSFAAPIAAKTGADGFAALASLVRRGGTAVTTRFVADTETLASRGVAGVNYRLEISTQLL